MFGFGVTSRDCKGVVLVIVQDKTTPLRSWLVGEI